ncbi:hypothetical protein GMDG_04128 [Pseudogymnoascus destructans 20631-21]|uniref:Uncharacterized protein n=1 Tax=Pseudogymnoascus destructans (strain ATCC MYA-4855 / 20631-21) TaxID=658429 RepID=L8G9A4_PSED2|nr:hypothetical protein GMDG_04128 [Pseudogymnoascus destructans 20631-21]
MPLQLRLLRRLRFPLQLLLSQQLKLRNSRLEYHTPLLPYRLRLHRHQPDPLRHPIPKRSPPPRINRQDHGSKRYSARMRRPLLPLRLLLLRHWQNSDLCPELRPEAPPPIIPPPTSPPASSTSPSSTSTLPTDSTSARETSTTISPLNVNPTSIPATCPRFPTTAIITGLLPGILAGILLSLTTFCLLGARRRRADARAPKISSPTYQGSDFRTDFVRRYQPSSPGTSTGTPATGISRVRSLFRKSSSAAAGARQTRGLGMGPPFSPSPRRGVPPIPDRDLRAYQQEALAGQLRREPSSESINIFADPSTARGGGLGVEERRQSAQTTFTDMMERADLRGVGQGEPYVLPVMPAREGEGEGARLSPARFSPGPRR